MKRIALGLILSFCALSAFSQKSLHRKAAKYFKQFEFASAAHVYEQIVENNANDQAAMSRLYLCYKILSYQELKGEVLPNKSEPISTSNRTPNQVRDLKDK